MSLAYLRSRKEVSKHQRVVGDDAKEVTKDQVAQVVGQEKELVHCEQIFAGTCTCVDWERNALNEPFLICVLHRPGRTVV